jgi:hypothetical protein
MLMPFGMAPSHASVSTHAPMAAKTMEHCPDNAPNHENKGSFAECTMACSAALPAAELADEGPLRVIHDPVEPALVRPLHGIHPDTATPPPKRS